MHLGKPVVLINFKRTSKSHECRHRRAGCAAPACKMPGHGPAAAGASTRQRLALGTKTSSMVGIVCCLGSWSSSSGLERLFFGGGLGMSKRLQQNFDCGVTFGHLPSMTSVRAWTKVRKSILLVRLNDLLSKRFLAYPPLLINLPKSCLPALQGGVVAPQALRLRRTVGRAVALRFSNLVNIGAGSCRSRHRPTANGCVVGRSVGQISGVPGQRHRTVRPSIKSTTKRASSTTTCIARTSFQVPKNAGHAF